MYLVVGLATFIGLFFLSMVRKSFSELETLSDLFVYIVFLIAASVLWPLSWVFGIWVMTESFGSQDLRGG